MQAAARAKGLNNCDARKGSCLAECDGRIVQRRSRVESRSKARVKYVSLGCKLQKRLKTAMGAARDKRMSSRSSVVSNSVAGKGHHQRVGFVSTAQPSKAIEEASSGGLARRVLSSRTSWATDWATADKRNATLDVKV